MNCKRIKTGLFVMILCIMTVLMCPGASVFAKSKKAGNIYRFDKEKITLYTGWDSYLCDVVGTGEEYDISYYSDDNEIAVISPEGEIFPVSEGSTTVFADVTEGDKTTTCSMKVTVKAPYSKLADSTDVMTLNDTFRFKLKRYGHEEPVTWTLQGEGYAEIIAEGATDCIIKTLKPGKVTLTASCMGETFTTDIKIYNGEGTLFIINPDSEPYNSNYVKYGTYNSKTKGYYLLRSYLERLNTLKGGVLVLQKGTYTVTNSLCIPSNTTIILEDGATIKKTDDTGSKSLTATASLFQTVSYTNASKEGVFKGYNGEHDIQILGEGRACIDLNNIMCQGIVSAHCKNLTISGISFFNMNTYHFIELDASCNVHITNNFFYGASESQTTRKEAINIDTPDKATGGFHQLWTSYDKTPNKDIYITDNIFYEVECGIATHKYSEGSAHKNINILRNTFFDIKTYAIRCMNWDKPVIKENCFIYSEVPELELVSIIVNGSVNPMITENRFENTVRPVSFYHWRNTGYGKEYSPIYNKLDTAYADALKKNYLKNSTNTYYEYYNVLDDFEEETLDIYFMNGYPTEK